MNLATMTSQDLLAHFVKTNDETALATLLDRHYQEVFEFVFTRYHRDRDAAAHITDKAFMLMQVTEPSKSFSKWLFWLAGNVAINYRDGKRQVNVGENLLFNPRTIDNAIGQLDEESQQVINLLYFEHVPEREVAEKLNTTCHQVRRIHREALAEIGSELRVSA